MVTPDAESTERMEFMLTLRRRGIGSQAVLRAMDEVPREHFVEDRFADSAYDDRALPIACGQTISQPYVVAYMTEQLDVRPTHRVLEVSTGSGYQAAVLSRLARQVVTLERYRTLADSARPRLKTLGYDNVEVLLADGGVMILPLGPHGGAQELVRLTKTNEGLKRENLIGVRFVPLLPGQAREL